MMSVRLSSDVSLRSYSGYKIVGFDAQRNLEKTTMLEKALRQENKNFSSKFELSLESGTIEFLVKN